MEADWDEILICGLQTELVNCYREMIQKCLLLELTFIMNRDLYLGPNHVVSLLQTVSSNSCPLTAGMDQEVVIVSKPFN